MGRREGRGREEGLGVRREAGNEGEGRDGERGEVRNRCETTEREKNIT